MWTDQSASAAMTKHNPARARIHRCVRGGDLSTPIYRSHDRSRCNDPFLSQDS